MMVEVKVSDRDDAYRALVRPDNLFWAKRWKTFLLGYEKYGSKACWEPVKPLRGCPENPSPSLEALFEQSSDRQMEGVENSLTWYTLEELEDIDLEDTMGVPEDPEKYTDYRYTIDTFLHGVDRDPEVPTAWFYKEQIKEALENGGKIEIEVTDDEKELPVSQREKMDKEISETKKATLEVKKRKRKDYAHNFDELINLMEKFRSEEVFDRFERFSEDGERSRPSKDEIRLVVWQSS